MIAPPASCVDDSGSPLCAADVARGGTRLLLRHGLVAMGEVPPEGGRRADLMAIDAKGGIVIVEIKVARADLLGDAKWTEYPDHSGGLLLTVRTGSEARPPAGTTYQ